MTKVRGLREDIQLGLALKQQMEQWLLTSYQTTNKHITKIDSLTAQPKHNKTY
ncbi:hypothetical protein [Entomomonas asaccharolytica]|uniref:Uncharacterized protein n=1 Tax=Entomomonas asaccharolytica TaxID=2785331 RepID=A0A974RWN8_9GAMM|nr:hypothetical protein [Entomomonas asaccharolytica]QQP85370.1 hypothetical protein JHT90_13470 [Entomomonas asaccharolytica]